ncbi:VOC family protein [Mesobacillus maritimus]|uniref:VOC family protein n=1 Tax=Mesobacillus maritimus TaxID=1643336 RepID=UPI00384B87C0
MRFHHYAIEVKDMEASILFYQNYLGFKIEQTLQFMGEEIVFLSLVDLKLELYLKQDKASHTQGIHLCFEVEDINEIMKDLPILEGPCQLENGWKTVFVEGPNHEVLEFLQIHSE